MGIANSLTIPNFNGFCGRCTVMILLLPMTMSLSLTPVSMGTDASFHRIPALGRTAQLGFLYDERTDEFRPISVFSRTIPADVVIETKDGGVTTETQIQMTNTFQDQIQLLKIGLNSAVNILAGNTNVRGTASIMKKSKENSLVQQGTLLRTHHTVEESLQLFYNDLRPFFNEYLLQYWDATHIVSGISWGSRISLTLQGTASPEVDAQELGNLIYEELQQIKRESLLASEEISENLNFTIDVQCDIPHYSVPVPTTIKDFEIILTKMPQLISDTNGGKGVPLEFTLTQLSELRNHLDVQTITNNSVHKIKDSTLRSLINIFDDILNSVQRLNDLHQNTYFQLNCLQPKTRDEIADLILSFLQYKKHFEDNVKETLVDVRSGSKPASTLQDIAYEFNQSNFCSENIKNKIREYDDVVEKVAFCKTVQILYSDIEYFGSRQNLIPRISENSDRPIYILFIKSEFKHKSPVKYTEDMNTFLKRLYVPSNKLFIVDCDGGNSLCSNLNQTEIHEYKNGKLASTDAKNHHVEELERNLEKRIVDLENNITALHILTSYLLEKHINDEPMDHCQSNPCHNGGVCHNGFYSFNCTCSPGFTGSTCNENVNECEWTESPCKNGGRCIDEIGGFTCVCPLPFAGHRCEENLDPCRINQCQNGASCVASPNYLDYECRCLDGFGGTLCDVCFFSPRCENGGTLNGDSCLCPEGYMGRYCGIVMDNCAWNTPCLNGGTCVNRINNYTCICAEGFSGNDCENRCTPFQFHCGDGSCIEREKECDGIADCPDGSDEDTIECRAGPQTCRPGFFRCGDGACVEDYICCDGRQHCRDLFDERNCSRCASTAFHCSDGQCIEGHLKCDRRQDCRDGSDEDNCEGRKCNADQYQCDDGFCIPDDYRCDTYTDCADGSDERNCQGTPPPAQQCSGEEFKCQAGGCISREAVCNSRFDCVDGSDELNCIVE